MLNWEFFQQDQGNNLVGHRSELQFLSVEICEQITHQAVVHLRARDVVGGGWRTFPLILKVHVTEKSGHKPHRPSWFYPHQPQRGDGHTAHLQVREGEEWPILVSFSASDSFLHALVCYTSKMGVMVLTSFIQCLVIN